MISVNGATALPSAARQNVGCAMSTRWCESSVTVMSVMSAAAARMKDAGQRSDLEAGMCKLFASEAGRFCVEESFRIHGGYGYSKEYEIERLMREAPFLLIGEGTSEIQKTIISRGLLKTYALKR